MDGGNIEEKPAAAAAGEDSQPDEVDHQRLARLVASGVEPPAAPAQASYPVQPDAPAQMRDAVPPAMYAQSYRAAPQTSAAAYLPPSLAAPRRSPVLLFVLLGLILFALVIGAVFFVLYRQTGSLNANSNYNHKPVSPSPSPTAGTSARHEMVLIPGGTFRMGRDNGPAQEGPAHDVTVKAFYMDNTEVTNGEYEEFVREAHYPPPIDWLGGKPLAGEEQWPVDNVSIDDANAFAAWRSKREGVRYRLPTEEEWEYAARNGEQATLYPWGNIWAEGRANITEASPTPVGFYRNGKNRWGVFDLIGNVWEWTSSKASYYPGNSQVVSPEHLDSMVYRGGSYATRQPQTEAMGTLRDWQKRTTKHPTLGFRLVRDSE